MTNHSHVLDVANLELTPSPAPARIISGNPTAKEFVIVDNGSIEIGIWEVTPGEFHSVKNEIGETVQFVFGSGRIVHPDGTVSPIAPGVIVEFLPGWEGTWHIEETTRKVYTIYSTADKNGADKKATDTTAADSSAA